MAGQFLPHAFAHSAGLVGTAALTGSALAGVAVFGPEAMAELSEQVTSPDGLAADWFNDKVATGDTVSTEDAVVNTLDSIGGAFQWVQNAAIQVAVGSVAAIEFVTGAIYNAFSDTDFVGNGFESAKEWLRGGLTNNIEIASSGDTALDKTTIEAAHKAVSEGTASIEDYHFKDAATRTEALDHLASLDGKSHPFWADKAGALGGAVVAGAAANKASGKSWVDSVKEAPVIGAVAR